VVVVWRFDRFARSVKQLVLALEEFRALADLLTMRCRGYYGTSSLQQSDGHRRRAKTERIGFSRHCNSPSGAVNAIQRFELWSIRSILF
jgi:DNA invertase Pin-like site-specific DNA recombinase